MPCKFCKSSSHTLAKCKSPTISDVILAVTALINSVPFKLKEQAELLNSFKAVQLSVVCRSIYGLPCNGNKNESIGYIIGHFFGHTELTSDAAIQTLSRQNTDLINQEYDKLVAWVAHEKDVDLRRSLLADMDTYYARRYGLRRYEYPLVVYFQAIVYLMTHPEVNMPTVNLQKLTITVTVSPDLPTEDCCICLNEKQMSSFNCGHSCCSGCLTSIAKKRTKSFVLCPLCRAEIQTLQVVNDDVLQQMNNEFIRC
jgi:hypothetical protein